MLIGPNAAIVFDRRVRSSYMANVYDFYKPNLSSEYPYVDGPLSNRCYMHALDQCFKLYFEKLTRLHSERDEKTITTLESFDGILFHAPYCKLVQKSIARMYLLDNLRLKSLDAALFASQLDQYK